MEKTDVLIIGGGALGVSTAYYLNRSGLEVTIVEKGAICSACSSGNAGLVSPSHVIPLSAPGVIHQGMKWMLNPRSPFYIKPRMDSALYTWLKYFMRSATPEHVEKSAPVLKTFCEFSRKLYADISRDENLDFKLTNNGLMMLYLNPKGQKECRELADASHRVNLENRFISPAEIVEIDPEMRTRAEGALFFPGDSYLEPFIFVKKLSDFLGKNGVRLLTETAVTGIETRNGEISEIQTSNGPLTAREYVLAAGAWSGKFAENLGTSLPLQPAKGYSITLNRPPVQLKVASILTEAKVAVTPMGSTLRFAGTLELAGISETINMRRVKAIRDAVPKYFLNIPAPDLEKTEIWGGMRPCTPDGLPYIGRFPQYRNLIAATGHAMLGITLAPATGKLVAEIITGKTPSLDLSPFQTSRFG